MKSKFLSLKFLLILSILIFSCSTKTNDPSKEQKVLVGVLAWQHDCATTDNDNKIKWKNPHYEIGFTRLDNPKQQDWESLNNQLVVTKGIVTKKHTADKIKNAWHHRLLESPQQCAVIQARSDFVDSTSGTRLIRKVNHETGSVAQFHAIETKAFKDFHVSQDGDTVTPNIKNIFQKSLSNLKIIAHYEGCFKKPLNTKKEKILKTLRPGKTASANFPTFVKEVRNPKYPEKKFFYTLNSIQILSNHPSILFDFDWPVDMHLSIPTCQELNEKVDPLK